MPSLAEILNAIATITADEASGPMIAKLVKQIQTETAHLSAKATATLPAPFAPEPGMKIPGGDYLLTEMMTMTDLSVIFHGTQELWRGTPDAFVRPVVVKIITFAGHTPEKRRVKLARMRQEAEITARRINSPNIVETYDAFPLFGPNGDPVAACLVMEDHDYDLDEFARQLGYVLPLRLARHLMRQVCQGFLYAHRFDILHRDMKPTNVLIAGGPGPRDTDGAASDDPLAGSHAAGCSVEYSNAKVSDFGSGKYTGDDINPDLTQGGILGTLNYMAWEQALGHGCKASDIYGIGATFYRVLSGFMPFQIDEGSRTGHQILQMLQCGEPVMPLSQRPTAAYLEGTGIIELIERMMDKDPEKRPTAEEADLILEEMVLPRDPPSNMARTIVFRGKAGEETTDSPSI